MMESDFDFLLLGLALIAISISILALKIRRYRPANIFYPGYYIGYPGLMLIFLSGILIVASFFGWL